MKKSKKNINEPKPKECPKCGEEWEPHLLRPYCPECRLELI